MVEITPVAGNGPGQDYDSELQGPGGNEVPLFDPFSMANAIIAERQLLAPGTWHRAPGTKTKS